MKYSDLFKAIQEGNLALVKKCLDLGLSPSVKNYLGLTAMDLAHEKKNEAILDCLSVALEKEAQGDFISVRSATYSMDDEICIVGYSSVFPQSGDSPERFWQRLTSGEDAIVEVPSDRWPHADFYDPDRSAEGKMYTRGGGFIEQSPYSFDAAFFKIVPKEAETMDPQQRLMLSSIWHAMEHAAIDPNRLRGQSVGVFCGIMTHDYADMMIQDGIKHSNFIGTGNGASVLSGRVSYYFGFQGPSVTIDTACSSSLVTTHLAFNSLRLGECDVAFSAGVNLMLAPGVTINCCKANMLAEDGRCKTFSDDADGYGRGEGCGAVVLMRYQDALRAGYRIYGFINGSAVNQDGASSGLTVPNKSAQVAVIKQALKTAKLQADDIDYVEAHGTGTQLGDVIEVNALKEVFANRQATLPPVNISSVKMVVGHLEAAAGVAGLIGSLLSLQYQRFPEPPAKLRNKPINAKITLSNNLAIVQQDQQWLRDGRRSRRAGISSFGFSGTNAHVIIEEPEQIQLPDKLRLQWQFGNEDILPEAGWPSKDSSLQLLTLSGHSHSALTALIERYCLTLTSQREDKEAWLNFCYTSNVGRAHLHYRIAIIASGFGDCLSQLQQYDSSQEKSHRKTQVAIEASELQQLSLQSFMQRYQKDTGYRVVVENLKNNLQPEYRKMVDNFFKTDSAFLAELPLTQQLVVSLFLSFAWVSRLCQMGLIIQRISSSGTGHYLAAVLDERLSLKHAMLLVSHLAQEKMLDGHALTDQIMVQPSAGLWPVEPASDLWQRIALSQLPAVVADHTMISVKLDASPRSLLEVLNQAYQSGVEINWQAYWRGSLRESVLLPQYPFQGSHYHYRAQLHPAQMEQVSMTAAYDECWEALDMSQFERLSADQPVILFKLASDKAQQTPWYEAFREKIRSESIKPLWLYSGVRGQSEDSYQIDFSSRADWQWLGEQLKIGNITRVVDVSFLEFTHLSEANIGNQALLSEIEKTLWVNHELLCACITKHPSCDLLIATTNGASDNRILNFISSGLSAQVRAAANEYRAIMATLQLPQEVGSQFQALFSILDKRISSANLLWRDGEWQHKTLRTTVDLSETVSLPHYAENEGVLITGGIGALGLSITKWFAKKGVQHIALLGRRKMDQKIQRTIDDLMNQYHNHIYYFSVDVTQQAEVQGIIKLFSEKCVIHGVFHLAGQADLGLMTQLSREALNRSLAAKVLGALHLRSALMTLPLWPRHVVMFSSSASVLPELGQSTYCIANAMLDELAQQSEQTAYPIQSINWGLWGEVGVGASDGFIKRLRKGSGVLSLQEAEYFFWRILQAQHTQTAVLNIDWPVYGTQLPLTLKTLTHRFSRDREPAQAIRLSSERSRLRALPAVKRRQSLLKIVLNIIQAITGLLPSELKEDQRFDEDLSIDSNLLTEIQQGIQERIGDSDKPLAVTLLFDHPNIKDLVDYLLIETEPLPTDITEAENTPADYIRSQVKTQSGKINIKTMQVGADPDYPPLILIHTIMGSVFFYKALVAHLNYPGSIYGIDNPFFSSLTQKFQSIEAMSLEYAQAIMTRFPNSPVRLAGLSFAGCVAYEIGQQLVKQHKQIDSVLMFDTAMPQASELVLPSREHAEYVMGEIAEDINDYYQAEIENNQKILNKYRPSAPLDAMRVILLKSRSRDTINSALSSLNLVDNGWLSILFPEIYSIPGSHFSIFDKGYIQSTVQAVRYVYDRMESSNINSTIAPEARLAHLLLHAAKQGDSYLVLRLLQEGVDPLAVREANQTAAHYAAKNDDLCSLSWILFKVGDGKIAMDGLITAAVQGSCLKTMSYLVSGPDLSQTPDMTLLADSNKKQKAIFSDQTNRYEQREWMQILADHNTSKLGSHTAGSMLAVTEIAQTDRLERARASEASIKQVQKIILGNNFSYEVVNCLRKGDPHYSPLFLIHAASGLALPYSNLDDFYNGSVYGISNPFFGNEDSLGFDSIIDMAKHYVERIKVIQPHGPYYLGGWSLGGIVAATMASLLESQNEKIQAVIMIDSVNHFKKPNFPSSESGAVTRILEKNDSIARFPHMAEAIKRRYLHTSHLLNKYQAPTWNGKVFLLKAEQHEQEQKEDHSTLSQWRREVLDDPFCDWGTTFQHIEVYSVSGGHNELFDKKYISGIQQALKHICDSELDNSICDISQRWGMNLVKALRRHDERMINLLMKAVQTDYSYHDAQGNLLDAIAEAGRGDLFSGLNHASLATLATRDQFTASEVALSLGCHDFFIRSTESQEVSKRRYLSSKKLQQNFFRFPPAGEEKQDVDHQYSGSQKMEFI